MTLDYWGTSGLDSHCWRAIMVRHGEEDNFLVGFGETPAGAISDLAACAEDFGLLDADLGNKS